MVESFDRPKKNGGFNRELIFYHEIEDVDVFKLKREGEGDGRTPN
jgi:hypothetical protein